MKKRYALAQNVNQEVLTKAGFKNGCWQYKDDHDRMSIWRPLIGEIELHIDVDFTTGVWNDFDNILVLDDNFCQPYTPFYESDLDNPFECLKKVLERYNEVMDSFVDKGVLIEVCS